MFSQISPNPVSQVHCWCSACWPLGPNSALALSTQQHSLLALRFLQLVRLSVWLTGPQFPTQFLALLTAELWHLFWLKAGAFHSLLSHLHHHHHIQTLYQRYSSHPASMPSENEFSNTTLDFFFLFDEPLTILPSSPACPCFHPWVFLPFCALPLSHLTHSPKDPITPHQWTISMNLLPPLLANLYESSPPITGQSL